MPYYVIVIFMANSSELYLTQTDAFQFGANLGQLLPHMLKRSEDLHDALAAKVADAGGSCEVVWPPDGHYRSHYTITKSSSDPTDTGFNVTENRDLHHLYADQPARVGVSAGRLATLWSSDGYSSRADRPLMLDEVSRLAGRIVDGRILQPNEIADCGRVYRSHSPRYFAHRLARTIFGANF